MTLRKISIEALFHLCFVLFLQALAELCEIKFGKTHPVCNLVSIQLDVQSYILALQCSSSCPRGWDYLGRLFQVKSPNSLVPSSISLRCVILFACLVIVFVVYTFIIPVDISTEIWALLILFMTPSLLLDRRRARQNSPVHGKGRGLYLAT